MHWVGYSESPLKSEFNGAAERVSVGDVPVLYHVHRSAAARDLTQHAIPAPDVGTYIRRTQLAPREVREGKLNENSRTRCRCDHASSSSGRFQSSPSAASLSNAVSDARGRLLVEDGHKRPARDAKPDLIEQPDTSVFVDDGSTILIIEFASSLPDDRNRVHVGAPQGCPPSVGAVRP